MALGIFTEFSQDEDEDDDKPLKPHKVISMMNWISHHIPAASNLDFH